MLKEVIASFNNIGFTVRDPQFADINSPDGNVKLIAVRGEQEVVSSFSLSNEVDSHWDGIEDSRCGESFLEYLKEMQNRGIEIEPARDDLKGPPRLRQAGAKELPDTQQSQKGQSS